MFHLPPGVFVQIQFSPTGVTGFMRKQCFRPEVKQQKETDAAESMPHLLPKFIYLWPNI